MLSPGEQALAREVHGDERRRAGGVHRHAGPLQAECIGEASGEYAQGVTPGEVDVYVGGVLQQVSVVAVARAREHPDPADVQLLGHEPGVLDGLPGHL